MVISGQQKIVSVAMCNSKRGPGRIDRGWFKVREDKTWQSPGKNETLHSVFDGKDCDNQSRHSRKRLQFLPDVFHGRTGNGGDAAHLGSAALHGAQIILQCYVRNPRGE